MLRTQISLPPVMHRKLNRLAQERGQSMAEIVRSAVEKELEASEQVDHSGKTAIRNLLNIRAKGGPKDLSYNLDHYLYGAPKRTYEEYTGDTD